MNWTNILSIEWVLPIGIRLDVGPILFGLIALSFLVWWSKWFPKIWGDIEVEAVINFPHIGNVKIKRNHEVARIAHQTWVELQTRKAALPFDEDHDIIAEVYDSWYAIFGEVRRLIKSVPAEYIQNNKDTEKLVNLMVAVLNDGLRPHLTCWQARFRMWYDAQESKGKSPQEIQRHFQDYQALVTDLKRVNVEMQKYADFLKLIAHGNRT